jgi:putative ABC transport system permease protein
MIPILAWRNIWRSPTRSLVVIMAVALGIWAAMSLSGFATGMMRSYVNNSVEDIVAHIQIHETDFLDEYSTQYYLRHPDQLEAAIEKTEGVRAFSIRSVARGMVASGRGSRVVKINGIDPETERDVSTIEANITEGKYLSGKGRNPILISEELRDLLKIKLRSKVVLTFQDVDNEIVSEAFKVVGIFETGNTPYDQSNVFVQKSDINSSIAANDAVDIAHEIAILVSDLQKVDTVASDLREAVFSVALQTDEEANNRWLSIKEAQQEDEYSVDSLKTAISGISVQTYREIAPELELYESMIGNISFIYLIIIMLALVFGIVNTMLMAVLERIKELGMLMAIGMNKVKVFGMIVLESILLGLVGAPIGLLLGHLTVSYVGENGINMSAYEDSLKNYGMSQVIYFDVDPSIYWQAPLFVFVTAVFAALYPAFKAIKLKPVEALRSL